MNRHLPSSGPEDAAGPPADSLVGNTMLSAAREGSLAALFVLGFLAARVLGPEGYGQYGTALAFVGLFRFLAELGMPMASAIASSRDRSVASALFGSVLGLQVVLGSAAAGACLLLGYTLLDGVTWAAVAILCADLLAGAIQTTLRWLLRSLDRFDLDTVSLGVERAVTLLAGAAALLSGGGVLGLVAVVATTRVLSTLGLFAWTRRHLVPIAPAWAPATSGAVLRVGLPLTLAASWTLLAIQIDSVLLAQLAGAREVGLYRAPLRIAEGLTLVPRALTVALLPSLAARASLAAGALDPAYRRSVKLLLLTSLPVATVGVVLAGPIVRLVFGAEYGDATGAARLALLAVAPLFLGILAQTVLASVGRSRALVGVSLLGLGVNGGLAVLLISSHGARGAAAATLVALIVHAGAALVAVRKAGIRGGGRRAVAAPLACALAAAAAAWVVRGWPVLLALGLAAGVWGVATVALRVWDERERETVRRVVGRVWGEKG